MRLSRPSLGRSTAVCLAQHVAHWAGSLDRRGSRSCALWHWLRERTVSECGRLRQGPTATRAATPAAAC
jgi:hypothetical protein